MTKNSIEKRKTNKAKPKAKEEPKPEPQKDDDSNNDKLVVLLNNVLSLIICIILCFIIPILLLHMLFVSLFIKPELTIISEIPGIYDYVSCCDTIEIPENMLQLIKSNYNKVITQIASSIDGLLKMYFITRLFDMKITKENLEAIIKNVGIIGQNMPDDKKTELQKQFAKNECPVKTLTKHDIDILLSNIPGVHLDNLEEFADITSKEISKPYGFNDIVNDYKNPRKYLKPGDNNYITPSQVRTDLGRNVSKFTTDDKYAKLLNSRDNNDAGYKNYGDQPIQRIRTGGSKKQGYKPKNKSRRVFIRFST